MPKRTDEPTVELRVAKLISPYSAFLARALCHQPIYNLVRVEGFSVRWEAGDCLVVVRGLQYDPLENVVVFGSGYCLLKALTNVSLAIAKGQWKRDKFRIGL